MSLQTAFISMKNISLSCMRLGQMIEQHMFNNPSMVFELGTQYVIAIEDKTESYFNANPEQTRKNLFMSEDNVCFSMKMNWIKEVHRQESNNKLELTTFQMLICYLFLLQITDWYIKTFEEKMLKTPQIAELQQVIFEDDFQMQDSIWQEISKTNVMFEHCMVGAQEETGKTISYITSIIYIPKAQTSINLQHLEITGCNHFLRELARKNIHTLQDLPNQLDGIYLELAGVGPTTVRKMWNQLTELFSSKVITKDRLDQSIENRMIHFSKETIELPQNIVHFEIEEKNFPGSAQAIMRMKNNGIFTYGDLPSQLLDLKKIQRIGPMRVKQFFNQLREVVPRVEEEQFLQNLTNKERIYYENELFVEWILNIKEDNRFSRLEKIPDRYIRIVNKRYKALMKQQHITLQQLGDEEGITRERVRQIIQRGNTLIAHKWKPYIDCVKEQLKNEGSILIDERFVSNSLSDYIHIQAFKLEGVYLHVKNSMRLLSLWNDARFKECVNTIQKDFDNTFDLELIHKKTYERYCTTAAEKYILPKEFINILITEWVYWINEKKGILKNVSKAKVVEMIMLNYPNGVAIYKQEARLNEEANKYMPGKFVRDRDFTSVFSREEVTNRLLLWARGVYIHRSFIVAEESWVRSIQHKAHSLLVQKAFIHVGKLFKQIETEARLQQIPNEYALFSMMRLYDEGILSLDRFPIIQLLGEKRLDNEQRVIAYIEEKENHVTKQELIQAFVEKRGWRLFTIEQILSDSQEIIQFEQGFYTLINNYDSIKEKQVSSLLLHLETMLEKSIVVSVYTMFNQHIVEVHALGIHTAHVLYALLKQWNQIEASFERFPYIMSNKVPNESINNRVIIEEFIAKQQTIVTRQEILTWLQTIMDSGDSILDFTLSTSNQIVYYKRGRYGEYLHLNTIGMNHNRKRLLMTNVQNVYQKLREITGKKYMTFQDLYDHIELPKLDNDIHWNRVLLVDLIKFSKDWCTFGSYDEVYMPKSQGCENDIDFIGHIIQTEFDGVILLSSLRLYLSEIRYSSTGDFRSSVQNTILKGDAPFVIEDEFAVHRDELEMFRERLKTIR